MESAPPELSARVRELVAARGVLGACDELKLHRNTVMRVLAGVGVRRFIVTELCSRLAGGAPHRAA